MIFFYSFCLYRCHYFRHCRRRSSLHTLLGIFFFLCPFYFNCYHHLILLHSNSLFFYFVLPLDRCNNLRHRSIHIHNIFVYFFLLWRFFCDIIGVHLCCRCFQYVLFSNFFLLFSFFFNNILFKLFISFLQVVIFVSFLNCVFNFICKFYYFIIFRWRRLIRCFLNFHHFYCIICVVKLSAGTFVSPSLN